jgi:hypothetical protein
MSSKNKGYIGKLSRAVKITDPLEMIGFIKTNSTNCQFVCLITKTVVDLKASWTRGEVVKFSKRNGLINVNYNLAVRNRIASVFNVDVKDVEYENGKVWFKHLQNEMGKPLPLVVNKKTPDSGKYYLQYFASKSKSRYVLADTETEVSYEELIPHLAKKPTLISAFKPTTCVFEIGNILEMRASRVIVTTNEATEAKEILV